MNFIDNIEIKNFKSIRHQKIEGCKRVNVFIGYPNVGKSNILEALSLVSYIKYKSQGISYKHLCRFNELIDIFNDGDKKKVADILIDDFLFSLEYVNKNEVDFEIKDLQVEKRKIKITSPETAAGIKQGIKTRFKIDKKGVLRHTESSNNSRYETPTLKKYQFGGSNFEMSIEPTSLVSPFGENLSEVIRHNNKLRKECGQLFSEYNLKLVFDENEDIFIQKPLDEYSAFQFSLSQVADTLQRLIFHKAAIDSNENSVLLFEEPEAHMFPPYISKFANDIVYDENGNQFFLTTHSPFVLHDLIDNVEQSDLSIYIVSYKKATGETLIYRMNEADVQEAYQFGYDFFMNIDQFIPQETHG